MYPAKIGLGGGCHWCTEAIFQSLVGVLEVEQGYISSIGEVSSFSEGVVIKYDPEIISLKTLIEIHLYTHKSTSNHSFRKKYRSAVYFFNSEGATEAEAVIDKLQKDFEEKIITRVYPFKAFRASRYPLQNYYLKNPEKPFCQRYIEPKLQVLREKFQKNLDSTF